MKILIVEDELPAAKQLERLLNRSSHFEGSIEGPIATISEAVELLKDQADYDLVFMDIHLADGPSFEIFKRSAYSGPIVFCTAYDQYALEAFKQNSIDYLLKPVEPEDLDRALSKFHQLSAKEHGNRLDTQALLEALQTQSKKGQSEFKSRFLVKLSDRMLTIAVADCLAFYSADKATFLLDRQGKSYPLEYSLDQLAGSINPKQFFRINRKYLIHLDAIDDMRSYSGSRIKLMIKHLMDNDILVSRDKTAEFKHWLDQ